MVESVGTGSLIRAVWSFVSEYFVIENLYVQDDSLCNFLLRYTLTLSSPFMIDEAYASAWLSLCVQMGDRHDPQARL